MSLIIAFVLMLAGYFYGKFESIPKYIYGYDMTNNQVLRMNTRTSAVEFILWEKGDQKNVDGIGHKENVWHEMNRSHWIKFTPYEPNNGE